MDSYKTRIDTRSINSQVNEQANSGLQRIKGQLVYVKLSHFMLTLSLFLAITNQDKIRKIDVSTMHAHDYVCYGSRPTLCSQARSLKVPVYTSA